MIKKITIIGRGVIGLASAFELIQRGVKVQVIGPSKTTGVASYAAVGISSIKGLRVARDDFFREKIAGHEGFPGFLRRVSKCSGIEVPIVSGVSEYFKDLNHYQKINERTYHGEFKGLLKTQIQNSYELNRYRILSTHHGMSHLFGAFYYADDLWFHPTTLLEALELAILKLGGKIEEEQVMRIIPYKDKSFKIEGCDRVFFCDDLVLACGEYTPRLLDNLSKDYFPFLRVSGQTLVATNPTSAKETFRIGRKALSINGPLLRYGSIDFEKNLIPTEKDLVRGKSKLINELSEDFSIKVCSQSSKFLWGTRLALKDRRPIIGKVPFLNGRGLWMSCGYHKNGFNLAELAAKALADQLLGLQTNKAKFYSLSRFVQ
ncbi:MAG: NAD(P)/FAD-dependent oxidoreductase [Oligoflexales bacterium]